MKQINNRKELNEELDRLKALNRQQETALTVRFKEIETSLQPQHLLRQGVTGLLKANSAKHGFIPVLVGAGVEAGLDLLLNSQVVQNKIINFSSEGLLQKLIGSIPALKNLFSKSNTEEKQPGEKQPGE
jgi:hypothetical protein